MSTPHIALRRDKAMREAPLNVTPCQSHTPDPLHFPLHLPMLTNHPCLPCIGGAFTGAFDHTCSPASLSCSPSHPQPFPPPAPSCLLDSSSALRRPFLARISARASTYSTSTASLPPLTTPLSSTGATVKRAILTWHLWGAGARGHSSPFLLQLRPVRLPARRWYLFVC